MTDEIRKYFMEKYAECSFRIVPGHWPDFKSKEEVDEWVDTWEKIMIAFAKEDAEVSP